MGLCWLVCGRWVGGFLLWCVVVLIFNTLYPCQLSLKDTLEKYFKCLNYGIIFPDFLDHEEEIL